MAARESVLSAPATRESRLSSFDDFVQSGKAPPAAVAAALYRWCCERIERQRAAGLVPRRVDVETLASASHAARTQLLRDYHRFGWAFYRSAETVDASALCSFARSVGLRSVDPGPAGGSSGPEEVRCLRVLQPRAAQAARGAGGDYVPFTNRPLNWHSDGYYNLPEHRVRTFVLHCVSPAAAGGVNRLLDPAYALVTVYEQNPTWVEAMLAPDALEIPANVAVGEAARPARPGPVFVLDRGAYAQEPARLHMRYTIRKRFVNWAHEAQLEAGRNWLQRWLEGPDCPFTELHLQAGEGLLCANVLHARSGFEDDPAKPRQLLRARYLERPSLPCDVMQ